MLTSSSTNERSGNDRSYNERSKDRFGDRSYDNTQEIKLSGLQERSFNIQEDGADVESSDSKEDGNISLGSIPRSVQKLLSKQPVNESGSKKRSVLAAPEDFKLI